MKMIEKYAYKKLQKEAAAIKRRVELPQPEKIRKVCVLWQPPQGEAYEFLHQFFQNSQVIFRNLCILSKEGIAEAGSNVVTPKDLNWLGFPNSGHVFEILKTEFDLLLNIVPEQNLVLHYITALSRARFKIGSTESKLNYFDLNIRINGSSDALYLAQQQIFYLEQLNKKVLV